MKNAARSLERDEVEGSFVPLRYGEAASYRLSQWLQALPANEWIAKKSRNVWPFTKLFTAINESRELLTLTEDWDEAGSPAIEPKTWERATDWVKRYAELLWDRRGIVLPAPRILPGPDGSIDIHWKTPRRELLLNIPANPEEPASYYGDDFGSDKKKGILETGALDMGLVSWLTAT
ncbi:MAG TPA: hypothetical protein VIA62_24250 [Thermoanaerobaculia bacterium]|jgi:hypothetical protein|nr:hypothetical protein [Thermoanaerobaculia bacterium]